MLEAALDGADDGLLVVDSSGKVLVANATAGRLLQITRGAILPPELMADAQPIARALSGEVPETSTTYVPPGSGSPLRLSATPLGRTAAGGTAATVTVRAIPEPAEREEKFRRERDWAWSIVEMVGSLVVVLDREGRVIGFNSACEAATGYSLAEMRGKLLWENLLVPEEIDGVQAVFRELRAGRFPNSHENYWVTRDGARRLISWTNTALLGRNGEVEYIIGTGVDITERRRAEDELRQVNETLGAIIDTSPLAIVGMDLDGKVVSWNRAAQQIFGWREEEVLGQVFPAVPDEDMEFFRGNLDRIRRGETLAGVERQRKRKDGKFVDVGLWNAPRRDAAGRVVGAISVIADMTERKRLEEQFRQAQKMEAVGRLAGGVAHDFNNLLTVITGYSQMVMDSLAADDPLRGHMEEVLRASESAAALTNQLLAFSRRQVVQPQV
ncbi:MAG: PAS domain S-box protein, partial [Bryobacteraceae bacterium]